MYSKYAYGISDNPNSAYNFILNHGSYDTGLELRNDTTKPEVGNKGLRINHSASDNTTLDLRSSTGAVNSFSFRLQDDSAPSSFSDMMVLTDDNKSLVNTYGMKVGGRMKASQYFIGENDTRTPSTPGLYIGQDTNSGAYFNMNYGTGSGGFKFSTYDSTGNTKTSNLELDRFGYAKMPYYSASSDPLDTESSSAIVTFDSAGKLIRDYQQNARLRSSESRASTLETTVLPSISGKVNEIISRMNAVAFFNSNIPNMVLGQTPVAYTPPAASTTLNMNVDLTTANDPTFQQSLINSTATTLDVNPSQVSIGSITTGTGASGGRFTVGSGVNIEIIIAPDPTGVKKVNPQVAAQTLAVQAQSTTSPFITTLKQARGGVNPVNTSFVPPTKVVTNITPAPTTPAPTTPAPTTPAPTTPAPTTPAPTTPAPTLISPYSAIPMNGLQFLMDSNNASCYNRTTTIGNIISGGGSASINGSYETSVYNGRQAVHIINSSGNSSANTSNITLQSYPVQTISIWFYRTANIGSYFGDGRNSNAETYIWGGIAGTVWNGGTMYIDNVQSTINWTVTFPSTLYDLNKWHHVTFIANNVHTGIYNLFSRYVGGEGVDIHVGMIAVYNRAISASENTSLYNWYNNTYPSPSYPSSGLAFMIDANNTNCYNGGTSIQNMSGTGTATISGTYESGTFGGSKTIHIINNSTNNQANGSNISIPSATVQTISMWFYLSIPGGASYVSTSYVADGRPTVDNTWMYNGYPGTVWANGTMYIDNVSSTLNWGSTLPSVFYRANEWHHITFIANNAHTTLYKLFSRYTNVEGLDIHLGSLFMYDRAITASENTQLYNWFAKNYTNYYSISSGTKSLTFTDPATIELFMIGGGGGGGAEHGGGGGSGAYYYTNGTPLSIAAGTTLNVNVGTGGVGGKANGTGNGYATSTRGGDTYITVNGTDFKRVAGGGGGGGYIDGTGSANKNGGCGGGGQSYNNVNINILSIAGGSSVPGTNGTGFAGGAGYANQQGGYLIGGGGGGCGGVGDDAKTAGANGGSAISVSISGAPSAYGGGGGGGTWDDMHWTPGKGGSVTINGTVIKVGGDASVGSSAHTPGSSGVADTGSGGGGGGSYQCDGGPGAGGKVLIKVLTGKSGVTLS